jgi:hypothetical protein
MVRLQPFMTVRKITLCTRDPVAQTLHKMEKALEGMIPHLPTGHEALQGLEKQSSRLKKAVADKLEDSKRHIQ